MNLKTIFSFFLIVFSYAIIYTQSNISIDHYSKDYGLFYRWVYDITQDDQGFLWFANHTGLRRYDGIDFVTYQHSERDSNSISTNTIIQVTKDHEGNIWAYGNDKVFNKMDIASGKVTKTNSFIRNGILQPGSALDMKHFGALINGDFIVMLQNNKSIDRNSNCSIWKYIPDKNVFQHLLDINPEGAYVDYFTERSDGKLWLWAMGMGYYLVDLSNNIVEYFPVNSTGVKTAQNRVVPVDEQRKFWYPSDLSEKTKEVDGLKSFKIPEEVDIGKIDRINLDNVGNIWFYHKEEEVYHFDIKTDNLEKFVDPIFKKSRGIQLMNHFFVDHEGAFWNGHIWGAVRFTKRQNLFNKYFNHPIVEGNLNINQFSSRDIIQLSSNFLLVKENGNDLFTIDLTTQKVKNISRKSSSPSGEKITHSIYSMVLSRDGFLWTNEVDKLVKTNIDNGAIEIIDIPVSQYAEDYDEDTRQTYWPRIFEDASGNLWWCDQEGLYIFEKSAKKLETISVNYPPLSVDANFKYSSYDPKADAIYGMYNEGIYMVNCSNKTVSLIKIFTEKESYDILSTAILKWNNEFWLSTNKGLIRYNPETKERKSYTSKDGLSSNIIYSTLGSKNDLWLATQNGLSQFNPYNMQSTSFYKEQGLPDNEFNQWSYHRTADGNLFFGGPNGIIGFDPDDFVIQERALGQLHLIEYSKYNEKKDALTTLQNHSSPNDITIGANERSVSFKYVLTTYSDVKKNQYFYYMDGLEREWIENENINEVRYPQLPPGNYTFRVKAKGPHNIEALNEIAIPVLVKQYWYKSWWAISSYILLLACGIVMVYRFQLDQKLKKQETFRIKELDQLKTKMYTNITHDFRTPLTVMLGMNEAVKDYAHDGNMEKLDHANEMVDRNGQNLLNLVNQMLDLSKIESGLLEIFNQQEDIIAYLKYRLEPLQSYAAEKNIQLHFQADEDKIIMDFDRDKISHIVSNLVANAIKFTPEKGNINVNVRKVITNKSKPLLELNVKDDGIGIESNKIENIFDRYYQVPKTNNGNGEGSQLYNYESSRGGSGTGIGLSLVKELIKLLKGSIDVNSEINKGTEFSITLPISNNAPFAKSRDSSVSIQNSSSSIDSTTEYEDAFNNENKEAPLVLIVEDNADVLHYIGISLKDHYRSVIARNGSEGIEKAIELIPDLIISDVMMPIKDGFELCGAIKKDERTSHIPVILLTAKVDDDSKIEGLEHGADAYLSKPFNRKELLIRLKNLLTLRTELQKKYSQIDFSKDVDEIPIKVDPLLIKIRTLITENIEEEDFNVSQLCKSLFLSRAQLHRKLIALTGQSTSHLIRSIRLEKAKELLSLGQLNISEVAYQVGFKTQAHFSRVFSDANGVSPSDYRAKL